MVEDLSLPDPKGGKNNRGRLETRDNREGKPSAGKEARRGSANAGVSEFDEEPQ